jgi:formate dehydrogenase subunit gamma
MARTGSRWIGRILVAIGLAAALLAPPAHDAAAQTSPPARTGAANDADLLQYLRNHPGNVEGRVTIPDLKSGLLIQPDGREWRELREGPVKLIGAVLFLGALAGIGGFYLYRGRVRVEKGLSGRKILRFTSFERFVHWMTASSFIVLGLTGLALVFGKAVLIPVLGPEAFAELARLGKIAHNFLSFPFAIGVVLMFGLWVADNIPNKLDLAWWKAGGGLLPGGGHPQARKFNGGQKVIFWLVVLGGAAISVTGYILMFPFYVTGIAGMQLSYALHSIISLVLIAAIIGHIYIGSLGMEGAFDAMGTGEVDLNWAMEHHSLWVQEAMSRGAAAGPAMASRAGAD